MKSTHQMMKKRVPDWLNSSLWSSSSPPPSPSPSPCLSAEDDRLQSTSAVEPQLHPPVPVPPPAAARPDPPKPPSQPSDSHNSSNDEYDSSAGPSPDDISRQAQLLAELSKKVVNMRELRRMASQGIPDGAGIRSTVWKTDATRNLEKSTGFDNDEPKGEGSGLLSRSEIRHGEHPLSLGKSSVWNQFFQDRDYRAN